MPSRTGLTHWNYARFEPIIKAAIESFPHQVEVDWTTSKFTYTTYVNRLRDSIKALRENPQWAITWAKPEFTERLSLLRVLRHPDFDTRVIVGCGPANNPHHTNVGTIELPLTEQELKHLEAFAPVELVLVTSANSPTNVAEVVYFYANLGQHVSGLPKLRILKAGIADQDKLFSLLEQLCANNGKALQNLETDFIIS